MEEKMCGILLKRLNDILTRQVNNELRSKGLTMTQIRVLTLLDQRPDGTASMKAIEKEMAVSQPTSVGVYKRLLEKGMVTYLPDPDNKRAKWLRLTDEGKSHCQTAYGNMNRTEARLLSLMDKKEKSDFYRLLEKALQAMEGDKKDKG